MSQMYYIYDKYKSEEAAKHAVEKLRKQGDFARIEERTKGVYSVYYRTPKNRGYTDAFGKVHKGRKKK